VGEDLRDVNMQFLPGTLPRRPRRRAWVSSRSDKPRANCTRCSMTSSPNPGMLKFTTWSIERFALVKFAMTSRFLCREPKCYRRPCLRPFVEGSDFAALCIARTLFTRPMHHQSTVVPHSLSRRKARVVVCVRRVTSITLRRSQT
jgi:hypothetical protein